MNVIRTKGYSATTVDNSCHSAGVTKGGFFHHLESKEIPSLEPGAMSYMMSKASDLGDSVGHWHPHLMFHGPRSDGADWSANLPGSPVLLDLQFQGEPEPLNTFMVPVLKWSDGTPAPSASNSLVPDDQPGNNFFAVSAISRP